MDFILGSHLSIWQAGIMTASGEVLLTDTRSLCCPGNDVNISANTGMRIMKWLQDMKLAYRSGLR